MRCLAVVVLFTILGCQEPEAWRPTRAPLQVTLSSDASEREVRAVLAGAERWHEELGQEVIQVRSSDDPGPRCEQVDVHFESMHGLANGTTIRGACGASIVLQSDMSESYMSVVAAHEIGHALGLDHDEDRASLMYTSAPRDGGQLSDFAIEYVADLLD